MIKLTKQELSNINKSNQIQIIVQNNPWML